MPFKFNPITSTLDLVGVSSGGSGSGVQNLGTSDDNAIARFDGVTGQFIQNSKAKIQDGGAVVAQGQITNKIITDTVTIDSNHVMVTSGFSIEIGGELVIEADGELAVV
jgi:hypothetical protein